MNREEIFEYVKKEYGTTQEYLWKKYPLYAVLKHNNKWYGIVMNVAKEKLGLEGKEEIDILVVKCIPEMIGSLRLSRGFFTCISYEQRALDGSVESKTIKQLIHLSYELIEK